MLPGFTFHHIGYATRSISKTADFFIQIGYRLSDLVYDEKQRVTIAFLSREDSPLIELVELVDELSPVAGVLKKNGVTPYHVCYQVEDIYKAIVDLKKLRFVLLFEPVEAIALENRLICYLYHKEVGLIEILGK
ncbi:MAG: hypothetical protein RIS29_520 [Bacteroidota bacterium]|jgi:methylmalonyl-CoA/ethylmalonyl-CoA epimerase